MIFLSNAALAGEHKHVAKDDVKPTSAATDTIVLNSSGIAAGMFGKPVVFRGTLGDAPIQAAVRPKEIIDEGLEGEYFIFGRSQKILLAGEVEGDSIFLEESENGTNISGQWEGKLEADSIQGTWLSADGSISKPFNLKLIRAQANSKPVQKMPSTESATSSTTKR